MSYLLPTHCESENCMINNPDNYPLLCTSCIFKAFSIMRDLPADEKTELFFSFKEAMGSGEYDEYIKKCCRDEGMSLEEYQEIEDEIWNDLLKGDE